MIVLCILVVEIGCIKLPDLVGVTLNRTSLDSVVYKAEDWQHLDIRPTRNTKTMLLAFQVCSCTYLYFGMHTLSYTSHVIVLIIISVAPIWEF